MKYVPPLPLRREVYSILRVKNVDHPEILTDLYLAEDLRQEALVHVPGAEVRLLIVGRALGVVAAGRLEGEAVDGAAERDQLPVNAGFPHLVLEGGDLRGGDGRIIPALVRDVPPLALLRVVPPPRGENSLVADRPASLRAGPGHLEPRPSSRA